MKACFNEDVNSNEADNDRENYARTAEAARYIATCSERRQDDIPVHCYYIEHLGSMSSILLL